MIFCVKTQNVNNTEHFIATFTQPLFEVEVNFDFLTRKANYVHISEFRKV